MGRPDHYSEQRIRRHFARAQHVCNRGRDSAADVFGGCRFGTGDYTLAIHQHSVRIGPSDVYAYSHAIPSAPGLLSCERARGIKNIKVSGMPKSAAPSTLEYPAALARAPAQAGPRPKQMVCTEKDRGATRPKASTPDMIPIK